MKYPVIALLLVGLAIACNEENVIQGPPKLDYYEESFEVNSLDFKPQNRIQYDYDAAERLVRYTFYGFNATTKKMEEQRHFLLSHGASGVQTMEGYNSTSESPYVTYAYSYLPDGSVSKIIEQNLATNLNAEAKFNYDADGKTVRVTYAYSNGGGFEYEYVHDANNNILTDKVTKGSQLCSSGTYTYDQAINPFANLGYVDFVLQNISTNNRLTEDVNYVGCGYPSFTPGSFEYEYNDLGYPTIATTTYVPAEPVRKSQKRFYYK